ncbi:hypothetical protein GALL_362350 [mine drainage metagenome]|uniref:Uncharacterized protein n=1 Tax=mine drainage metagenome TaxID=410659 RepID=A0A1J5QQ37_9ZZZZ
MRCSGQPPACSRFSSSGSCSRSLAATAGDDARSTQTPSAQGPGRTAAASAGGSSGESSRHIESTVSTCLRSAFKAGLRAIHCCSDARAARSGGTGRILIAGGGAIAVLSRAAAPTGTASVAPAG